MGQLTRRQLLLAPSPRERERRRLAVDAADTSMTPVTTISDVAPPTMASTTTTTLPAPGPIDSPLVVGALVVAGIATLLAVWRAARTGDR